MSPLCVAVAFLPVSDLGASAVSGSGFGCVNANLGLRSERAGKEVNATLDQKIISNRAYHMMSHVVMGPLQSVH